VIILLFFLILSIIFPQISFAHTTGETYNFPIPVWLYIFGSGLVLFISFVIFSIFSQSKNYALSVFSSQLSFSIPRIYLVRKLLTFSGLVLFLLMIASGFFGTQIAQYNFSTVYFWAFWMIGFIYIQSFIGDLWSYFNPFKTIVNLLQSLGGVSFSGKYQYPDFLGSYPVFIVYFILIVFELFYPLSPFGLSFSLFLYLNLTILGSLIFGKDVWFEKAEFFSVFFKLLSRQSVIYRSRGDKVDFKFPFVRLINIKAIPFSLVMVIFFLLSSTAFDSFRETAIWFNFYYDFLFPLLSWLPNWITDFIQPMILLLTPFLFFFIFLILLYIFKLCIASKKSLWELSSIYSLTLLPIGVFYHLAHYFTLFLNQGLEALVIFSDPLGLSWNLFGTAGLVFNNSFLPISLVWHMQVFLILLGHIIGVILAHNLSIKLTIGKRSGGFYQLPIIFLMIVFTMIGLWVLSQPLI